MTNGGTTWAIRLRGGDPIGTIGIFADQDTSIRGLGWSLACGHQLATTRHHQARQRVGGVIPYLLAQDGVDGLEAWVDSQNIASLGVARAAGMVEGGRLPRSYRDRVAQTIVMVRASQPRDPEVFGMFSTLHVTDLGSSIRLLTDLLDLHLAWSYPDPPRVAFLAVEPWSGSRGFQLEEAPGPVDSPQQMSFDVGIRVDEIGERALSAGLVVGEAPHDQPWDRREMTFALPDGHRITVSGPTLPRA